MGWIINWWFLRSTFRILAAHDFSVISADAHELDSEINAPFLLTEQKYCDSHFLFHNFNEGNVLNTEKKKNSNSL